MFQRRPFTRLRGLVRYGRPKHRHCTNGGPVLTLDQVNVPVVFNDDRVNATIEPGDFVVGDLNGVVHIPKSMIEQVLEQLNNIVKADELVARDIDNGATFAEASKQHRQK